MHWLDGRPPVHPRACGEQQDVRVPRFSKRQDAGSSPRLRGTAHNCITRRGRERIGSSPRLRGTVTPTSCRQGCRSIRFIPAPAGNRLASTRQRSAIQEAVHPRACGEQSIRHRPSASRTNRGSSPRLRGTGPGVCHRRGIIRFIPAPAGNSWHWRLADSGHSVHPRACGEQFVWLADGHSGSCRRFIPAPAGNSRFPGSLSRNGQRTVHPRACGEQPTMASLPEACHFRFIPAPAGNRRLSCAGAPSPQHRFIPAPAGNSVTSSLAWLPGVSSGSSPGLRGTARNLQSIASACVTVHPRACGEQSDGVRAKPGSYDRSVHPRACGEQFFGGGRHSLLRAAVHPRACGEQS